MIDMQPHLTIVFEVNSCLKKFHVICIQLCYWWYPQPVVMGNLSLLPRFHIRLNLSKCFFHQWVEASECLSHPSNPPPCTPEACHDVRKGQGVGERLLIFHQTGFLMIFSNMLKILAHLGGGFPQILPYHLPIFFLFRKHVCVRGKTSPHVKLCALEVKSSFANVDTEMLRIHQPGRRQLRFQLAAFLEHLI